MGNAAVSLARWLPLIAGALAFNAAFNFCSPFGSARSNLTRAEAHRSQHQRTRPARPTVRPCSLLGGCPGQRHPVSVRRGTASFLTEARIRRRTDLSRSGRPPSSMPGYPAAGGINLAFDSTRWCSPGWTSRTFFRHLVEQARHISRFWVGLTRPAARRLVVGRSSLPLGGFGRHVKPCRMGRGETRQFELQPAASRAMPEPAEVRCWDRQPPRLLTGLPLVLRVKRCSGHSTASASGRDFFACWRRKSDLVPSLKG